MEFKRGTEAELTVDRLAFGGQAVAKSDGFVIFLDHAIPGQRVRARITKRKKQYAEGRVVEVISQSPSYSKPFCRHFGVCGGCQWQDIPYETQLYWKRMHVLDSLERLAGLENLTIQPTSPSPQLIHYRNKMEFTFSSRRWLSREEIAASETLYERSLALGLHVRGFFDKVFNLEECWLESPLAVEILDDVRRWAIESGLPPYDLRGQQGYWRFLVIREAKATSQVLVNLITTDQPQHETLVDSIASRLCERHPGITTFIHAVSTKKSQVALGDASRVLIGPGYIEEILSGRRFRISAESFFQTNPYGAEKLYSAISRAADFRGDEKVWDLYCGTGSIALTIAPEVKRVVGIEVVPESIEDARVNQRLNGSENCEFFAGDLKDTIEGLAGSERFGSPDVVIADPPRAGMHPKVVKTLLEVSPRRIIAVSCNPGTLARDLAALLDRYDVREVLPFDLFPHTSHIECVVKLDLKQ